MKNRAPRSAYQGSDFPAAAYSLQPRGSEFRRATVKFAVARCSAGSRLALRAPASGGCELDPVRSPGFLASMRSARCARPRRRRGPAPDLPSDTLPYLRPSRYCDTELLADFAWANFSAASGEWARVQAICDFVHQRLRFSYPEARPTRTASEALAERVGVCRDFTHLAMALCRCLNMPARYCNGYLGDIGVPPDPALMDFNAWFEAFLGDRWFTFDPRHNWPRIGRILISRGRDGFAQAHALRCGHGRDQRMRNRRRLNAENQVEERGESPCSQFC